MSSENSSACPTQSDTVPTKASENTSAKVGKSRRKRRRELTVRQTEFLRLLTTGPYRSCARAAREAGYSESVARKPQIIFESQAVRRAWDEWLTANPEPDTFGETV